MGIKDGQGHHSNHALHILTTLVHMLIHSFIRSFIDPLNSGQLFSNHLVPPYPPDSTSVVSELTGLGFLLLLLVLLLATHIHN